MLRILAVIVSSCGCCNLGHFFAAFNFFFLKDFIYLFERENERQHEREEGQRERQTPRRAGSPMRDLIPGLQDHDLSRRQSLSQLSHTGAQSNFSNV